ncbi:XdhC family protein [Limnobaculum xujianqingii]|uniref:XdhC family protein n=1 Tax=Limnobaculum xujianqingii TaxID=2738837 RepID=UPI00112D519E|nr:XdhC family protein [Limnobaculum xujianqingii]
MVTSSLPTDQRVILQAIDWAIAQPVWLCTVLKTWGSSPRSPGALMVVNAEGNWCGSLSGGCVEQSFLRQIKAGQWRQLSQIVTYGDGGLEPDTRLPCGGRLDVLVEFLQPDDNTQRYLKRMLAAVNGSQPLQKQLILSHACHSLNDVNQRSAPGVDLSTGMVTIWHGASPRLVVAGWSSVAEYCVSFAYSLGFEVVICEPRPQFLTQLLPLVSSPISVLEQFPAVYLETEGCHPQTAIVALTHDARMDDLTIMEAVNTPAFYIGVMGSAKNSENRLKRLARTGGLTESELERVHAPVGLDIGSKTPSEIALSVMADIVKHKNLATILQENHDR